MNPIGDFLAIMELRALVGMTPDEQEALKAFLSRCRFCGERLSDQAEENLAIRAKAGPLLFHRHCADQLRLSLAGHILYRAAE